MTTKSPAGGAPLLLLIAGAKGAVASTLAVAAQTLRKTPAAVLDSLTTNGRFQALLNPEAVHTAGWDVTAAPLSAAVARQGVLPAETWESLRADLDQVPLCGPPPAEAPVEEQIARLMADIQRFRAAHPDARPVLIDLLPACESTGLGDRRDPDPREITRAAARCPDLVYGLAAVRAGVPVVNFSPNELEIPRLVAEAREHGVPICGRDGKTGQTYFKVVLASAFKARSLRVDGWYSLNILGNADGANLMDPCRAAGKYSNKTLLLDEILEYPVGAAYGVPTHKVHIDYYPPRGDAKEAWDVIDFKGLFGLPMSLRLNLQGRDSILAAPMALDLARWMAALQAAGRSGLVPELGFYFKKAVGEPAPVTFQDQLRALDRLARECEPA
ncbi:MAG TPA: inositol-3-phosphate synthase [Desulfobacterales bacterium]|nr:inositol-3-phosphate synthase [Desulfobacterales bacterium]